MVVEVDRDGDSVHARFMPREAHLLVRNHEGGIGGRHRRRRGGEDKSREEEEDDEESRSRLRHG